MYLRIPYRTLVLLISGWMLAACTSHQIYRTDNKLCTSSQPEVECTENALQFYQDPTYPQAEYTLGFIEFDDQGNLWSRKQMQTVVDHAITTAASDDLLLVVFVHGWKHSAMPGDQNIHTFRRVLRGLSELESKLTSETDQKAREVIGVYIGWRGDSVKVPLVKELTFWDRKNTAHKVGDGGVTEVLGRLEQIKRSKDAIAGGKDQSNTRLVVIGHSFGGAVVFSALSQIFADRFVKTIGPDGRVGDADGFGDLVVLINPAFEALRFSTLSDMANERATYFQSQLPIFAELTSEGDDATGVAFPLGRWFSTFWEKVREVERPNPVTGKTETVDQSDANLSALGHFEPYRTHKLVATDNAGETRPETLGTKSELSEYLLFSQQWDNDKPGSVIEFSGSKLERTPNSAGRNPYLLISVDEQLINDHNHIDDPRIISFIRQLIQLSAQNPVAKERAAVRSRALTK